jgi:hypothetical protein
MPIPSREAPDREPTTSKKVEVSNRHRCFGVMRFDKALKERQLSPRCAGLLVTVRSETIHPSGTPKRAGGPNSKHA